MKSLLFEDNYDGEALAITLPEHIMSQDKIKGIASVLKDSYYSHFFVGVMESFGDINPERIDLETALSNIHELKSEELLRTQKRLNELETGGQDLLDREKAKAEAYMADIFETACMETTNTSAVSTAVYNPLLRSFNLDEELAKKQADIKAIQEQIKSIDKAVKLVSTDI